MAGGPRRGPDLLLEHRDERHSVRSARRRRGVQARDRLLVPRRRHRGRRPRQQRRRRRGGVQRAPARRLQTRRRPRRHRTQLRKHRRRRGVPQTQRGHRQGAARHRRPGRHATLHRPRVAARAHGRHRQGWIQDTHTDPGAILAHRAPGLRFNLSRENRIGENRGIPLPGNHAHQRQARRIVPTARRSHRHRPRPDARTRDADPRRNGEIRQGHRHVLRLPLRRRAERAPAA